MNKLQLFTAIKDLKIHGAPLIIEKDEWDELYKTPPRILIGMWCSKINNSMGGRKYTTKTIGDAFYISRIK